MRYIEARQGRIFVLRLEDGDVVHEVIEQFAGEKSIRAAAVIIVGGAQRGSRLVVGPEHPDARPVHPIEHVLSDVHEIAGTGTVFPDEDGTPLLHLHMACGRETATVTGCIRSGVAVWQIMEAVVFELVGTAATRKKDPELGFKLLDI